MSLTASKAAGCAALLVCLSAAASALAACAGPEDLQSADCRSWIHSERPIYAARDGRLYKMHFDSPRRELLSDHALSSLKFWLSADARYIAYGGFSGGRYHAFVYDAVEHSDHALAVSDGPHFEPEFSPDSSELAWVDSSATAGTGTVAVMNLAGPTTRILDYPLAGGTWGASVTTEIRWSMDGQLLLASSAAGSDGAFYRIGLPALSLLPISGRYISYAGSGNPANAGIHFIVDGHEIEHYRPPCPQWQCQDQGRPAAGEHVRIYRNSLMTVTNPRGVEEVVARGGCDQCGDASVRVLSWLENGKYLVYQLRGATYLYGIAEGRTAKLFEPGWQFGWYDPDNRAPAIR